MKKLFFLKDYSFQSIFVRNLAFITLVLFVPLAFISAIIYTYSREIVNREIQIVSEGKANQVGKYLESIYTDLYSSMVILEMQEETYAFLLNSPLYQQNASEYSTSVEQLIKNIKVGKDYLDSVKLYSLHSEQVITNTGTWIGENERRVIDSLPKQFADRVLFVPNLSISYPKKFTMALPISLGNTLDGYILVDIDCRKLGEYLMQGESAENSLYLFNTDGRVLYSPDESILFRHKSNVDFLSGNSIENSIFSDENYIFAGYEAQRWGFSLLYCENMNLYNQQKAQMKEQVMLVIGLSALLGVLAVFVVSYKTYQPILQVKKAVEGLETDEMAGLGEDPLPEKNELIYIINSILQSKKKTADLDAELKKRIQTLNHAQTLTFQAQITPHFIYNTLDTFKWQAMELSGGNNDLSRSISKFSKLLRISIDGTQRLVPLAEELEHVKLYLDILKIRYEDKVSAVWEIEEQCQSLLIPKLSLQPLIENAVYHGIKPKASNGKVWITAMCKEETLVVEICDDGVGMSEEDLNKLRQDIDNSDFDIAKHVGVRNVNQRIKLIFGDEYGAKVDSILGKGTRITLQLPAVKDDC